MPFTGSDGKSFVWGAGQEGPVFPLKAEGSVSHLGWEVETLWAIDSSSPGRVWMNDGHCGSLRLVDADDLRKLVLTEKEEAGKQFDKVMEELAK